MTRRLIIQMVWMMVLCLLPLAALAGTVQIPRTGQITSYGQGDDGARQAGTPWPSPRFVDNGNGTVTDNLTGLIWLKNANCTETVGGIAKGSGTLNWANALTWSNSLASGACSLTDGSSAGQWRLPNRKELISLVNRQQANGAAWLNTVGFTAVQANHYWSSSTAAWDASKAWGVDVDKGSLSSYAKTIYFWVLPVRGGQ